MSGSGMEEAQNNIGKSLHSNSITRKCTKRSRKLKSHWNTRTSQMSKKKFVDSITNSKNQDFEHTNAANLSSVNCQNQKGGFTSEKRKRGRKRKLTNENIEVDEAAKLQRRTRYLLIRMKIEQNLLDAYSTEGWKGQSREKIKPERELQRAKKQILKCKLGLRDALRQLDLLSSDGCIDESVIAPDGSVHHDNIHCAKCKLREAYLDNDIILCDGTCNCAFHQMCIDPPLLTENIPPGDQGWFCKYCVCKTEIIDSMNAHLGTSYPHDTNWQDVFSVEATLPDDVDTILNQEEWPSDDSGDDDYDPDRIDNDDVSRVCSADKSSDDDNDDVNSSYSLMSLDDEVLDDNESCKIIRNTGLESTSGSGSGTDCEFVSGRRQRRSVDYRKLYDEMFGKDALANEQVSEDEDWGPTNKKRREKESDAASTLMALCENEELSVKDTAEVDQSDPNLSCNDNKRSFLRIPAEAVEKLRAVFAKNELPSRAVKEDISKQLGLDPEKVNTWFRNARQLSLKTKRAGEDTSNQNDIPSVLKESESEPVKNKSVVEFPLENNNDQNMSVNVIHTPVDRRSKKFRRRNNAMSATVIAKPQNETGEFHLLASTNKVDGDVDLGDNNSSLKIIKETTEKEKEKGFVVGGTSEGDDDQQARTAEAQMEKLCLLKTKLEKLQQVIQLRMPNRKGAKTPAPSIDHSHTIFVPVAHLKEKP